MKIGTLNLRNFLEAGEYTNYDGKKYSYTQEFVDKRIDYFARIITKNKLGAIFLQEVGSEKLLSSLAGKIGFKYFMGHGDFRGTGNAVLYNLPNCICSPFHPTGDLPVFVNGDKDTYAGRINSNREFILLETEYNGSPLRIIGLHIKSSIGIPEKDQSGKPKPIVTQLDAADGLIRSSLFRMSEARKLRGFADDLFSRDKNAQIIILGDFNSLNNDYIMRMIIGELKGGGGTLADLCEMVPKRKRFTFIKDGDKRFVDHVLASYSVRRQVKQVKILNQGLKRQGTSDEALMKIESDHAPIIVELM